MTDKFVPLIYGHMQKSGNWTHQPNPEVKASCENSVLNVNKSKPPVQVCKAKEKKSQEKKPKSAVFQKTWAEAEKTKTDLV